MSAPSVPARPARSQNQVQNPPQTTSLEPSQVPSRPSRLSARDASREREAYSRSPLNELPTARAGGFYQQHPGSNTSISNARAPSVASLPLIGQEGSEYASLDNIVDNESPSHQPAQSPNHTRNVHHDLPLHAPTASMAPNAAKDRVAAVTRTDSSSAAEAGIAKAQSENEENSLKLQYTTPSGHYRSSSQNNQEHRSPSTKPEDEPEHGIPMIGYQVPMYPNAGDVQAPSPSPYQHSQSTGVGFFNDATHRATPGESRRKSGHNFHVPPGSYGLHGHGGAPQDQFEKAWHQKHPKDASREESLNVERSQYSMTSEELNNLVRSTSRTGSGMGTSPAMISTPPETIGYQATEEYAQRIASRPVSLHPTKSRTGSFGHADSPLRRTVFPMNDEKVTDDEAEDDVIHVRPPSRNVGKITGGGYDPPTEDLGPHGGNTREQGGWINERGSGTPILASDELSRDPGAEYRLPAVSPEQERIGDTYFSGVDSDHPQPYQSGRSKSRSRSRPNAGHSALSRFVSHDHHHDSNSGTPLEEIEEYEPLFNDDDKETAKRPETASDRLKRPKMDNHRFPSQDIWEDTPSSLQLQTTVEHEQEPEESPVQPQSSTPAASLFESPEKEAARKGEVLESERLDFINDPNKGMAKPKFRAHVQQEAVAAPLGPQRRFPSHDIWEDTPDSLRLETTVDEPQSPQDEASPIEPRSLAAIATNTATMQGADRPSSLTSAPPSVPARPGQSHDQTEQPQPSVPARPSRAPQVSGDDNIASPTEKHGESSRIDRKAPSIPERPKPQVPARPSRPTHENSPEAAGPAPGVPVGSYSSDVAAPVINKPKPPVPARPAGTTSKFASLKAGFMENLNSRLQLGPQAPPKPQPTVEDAAAQDEEKAPLADARKGRAKGPARRKPVSSTGEESNGTGFSTAAAKFSIAAPWTVWSISTAASSSNDVHLGAAAKKPKPTPTAADLGEYPTASPLARNTAGEALLSSYEAPKTASGALAHGADAAMDARAQAEEKESNNQLKGYTEETIGFRGDVPEPAAEKPLSAYVTPLPQREAEASHSQQDTAQHAGTTAKLDVDDLDVPGAFPDEDVALSGTGMVNEAVQTGEMKVAAGGEARTIYLEGAAQTAEDIVT